MHGVVSVIDSTDENRRGRQEGGINSASLINSRADRFTAEGRIDIMLLNIKRSDKFMLNWVREIC